MKPTASQPHPTSYQSFNKCLCKYHVELRLAVALLDDYERGSSKTSRNDPRKKHRQGCGAPQIREATPEQIAAAKKLSANDKPIRLTA